MLFIAIPVFGLVFGAFMCYENNRNKETIVDLGNGWKSYTHEDIGFTVKIPEDAETKAGKMGEKNENFEAIFSKGDIEGVRAMGCCGMEDFGDPNNIDHVHKYYEVNNDKDYEWRYSSSSKDRKYFSRETIVDGRVIIFNFSLSPFSKEGSESNALRVVATDPYVIGKERRHDIDLKSFDIIIPKIAEDGTPRLKEEIEKDIEDFVEKKIDIVKGLVISINNF